MGLFCSSIMSNNHIYVCQAGTCRSKGSDAALIEIEELSKLVSTKCHVERSGCLGYCRRAPAVEVYNKRTRSRRYHVKVNTFRKSAAVVEDASGEAPPLHNLPEETESRLADIRAAKQREYFMSTFQWNKALSGLTESSRYDTQTRDICQKAGYHLDDVLNSNQTLEMPNYIANYVSWKLSSVDVVSRHSAVFQFETKDVKRGTPHPRGRARMAEPVTWHVTMLGEVGTNSEGPLPYIERDYTPISCALEWERGRCAILIKIYNDGLLTSWLHEHQKSNGTHVWLSKPVRTLSVPSLIPDDDDGFRPKSVLLLLAGTGIVALPQIMAHREPHRLLGISLPRYKQMACHIDLIFSCREDDILMLPEIKQYCIEGIRPHPKYTGLRNCTLLLTKEKKQEESLPPFNGIFKDNVDYNAILKDAPTNFKTLFSRLDKTLVEEAVSRMDYPYRVIVSGPDSYNNAARELLEECNMESKHVTILSA